MKKVTINDIAMQAGVSKATVSRVLNNSGPVDTETQKRVLKIIERLDYSPSATARNLSRSESTTIGVLIPEIENPFFGEILREISTVIGENGLTMICFNSGNDPAVDEKYLTTMRDYNVRGVIYTAADDFRGKHEKARIAKLLKDIGAPVVLLDRKPEYLTNVDRVYFDNWQGAYEATKTFIETGHKKIGIINAQLERVLARERQDGYLAALREYGIQEREDYIFIGDYTVETSYQLSKKCLSMEDRPTAILTCNNFTSLGFLKAAREAGVKTPDDISCIGFDRIDTELLGIEFNYIERNTSTMGRKAIELLMSRMALPHKPHTDAVISPEIVIYKV